MIHQNVRKAGDWSEYLVYRMMILSTLQWFQVIHILWFFLVSGIFVIVFCVNMWQVYLASGLQILAFCKFSLVRSLLSKCVEPEETGKMFSVLAIFCALMPLLANSTFRPLYSWTLPIFPGAILIMAGSLLTISALLNLYLYTQRHRMVYDTSQQLIDNNNQKQSKNPSIRGRRNSFVTSMWKKKFKKPNT